MRTSISSVGVLLISSGLCVAQSKDDYKIVSGTLTDMALRNGYLNLSLGATVYRGLPTD